MILEVPEDQYVEIDGAQYLGKTQVKKGALPFIHYGFGVAYHLWDDNAIGRHCANCAMQKNAWYANIIHPANYARYCATCGCDLKEGATR